MQAAIIREHGGPEVLALAEADAPVAQRGEVLVRVRAAAVNRADLLQRAGKYPAPDGCVGNIPGLEFSGEVDTTGDGVKEWRRGDRVFGLVPGGSYAQFLVVHSRCLSRMPDHLSFTEAAALPEATITAYDAMVSQCGLGAGEFVLITAAASGVGTAAIQIARCIGATPIGTTRSQEKVAKLKEIGLDQIVVAKDGAYAEAVMQLTNGSGVDVVLELAGGDYVNEDLQCLRYRGRIVVVGLLGGAKCSLNLGQVLSRRAEIRGTTLRARPLEEKMQVMQAFGRHVVPLIERGLIKPVIDKQFELAQAAQAHEFLEGNKSFGKVVLVVP